MAHKTLVGGTSYEISGGKTLVNSTAYSISGGKTLVGGTAYKIGFGTPIGDLEVGSSVYMNVNGVSTEFLVVHQGLPDATLYDASCDGAWLLMKDIYEKRYWNSYQNEYANNNGVHKYLRDTFINLFDGDIKNIIKQVKVPYTNGTGSGGTLATGASGLSVKVFLLSLAEVREGAHDYANTEGSVLDYFKGAADSKRAATFNGAVEDWSLRSPSRYSTSLAWIVGGTGTPSRVSLTNNYGLRPAMILPKDIKIDENFNVIA